MRPRLTAKVRAALAATGSVLVVNASAGAGKTTAIRHALAHHEHPVAWLTLDRFDVSPGRLSTFLESALQNAGVLTAPVVAPALKRGSSHADAARLLARRVDREVVLVLDEVEQVADAPAALAVIEAFVGGAGGGRRLVLLSRRALELGVVAHGRLAYLTDTDLAFTPEEARAALASFGRQDVDVEKAVSAAGGWVTGVVYGPSCSERGVTDERDDAESPEGPLFRKLVDGLSEPARELLVETSLLDVVTEDAARRLGLDSTADVLLELRSAHLPIDFVASDTFSCHPRFRDHLLARLGDTRVSRQRAIHSAHAELLRRGGDLEEAVHASLLAGDLDQAEETASAVVPAVVQRLDYDVLESWLAAFRPDSIKVSEQLTAAELVLALDRERFAQGAACADRLEALAARNGSALGPELVGPMAWCYFLVGRLADAVQILDTHPRSPATDVVRFAIGAELVDDPTHYRDRPPESGTAMDGLLAQIDLGHGRFESLLVPRTVESRAVMLSRAGALVQLGDHVRARETFEGTPGKGWLRIRLWAEFMAECGRPEDAWAALIDHRERLATSGSGFYRMVAWLAEAMIALRFGRDTALATAALRAAEREPTAMRRIKVLEQLALWHGLIGLLDDNTTTALHHLREATGLMTYWDRRPLLPRAAVYLAEAEWRAGDESAAERAANLALGAATTSGTRYGLVQALREFPDVLSRQIDAARDPDSPWHEMGRSMLRSGVSQLHSPHPTLVQVVEFGTCGVRVNGCNHELTLVRSVELLSYLAARGGTADKDEIISDLFDSKSSKSAQAYLRAALARVRAVPGLASALITDAASVTWRGGRLTTDFDRVEEALVRLGRRADRVRYDEAVELRDGLPRGEYLPGARSPWAVRRREAWDQLVVAVHHAAAEAAYDCSDYLACHQMATDVLRRDPFRESAWRLKMRAAAALGDGDQVIALYRECERSLAEVPTRPAESTRRLLEQLRF
ncbi:BTAD domain-containing putative transcriptional regulator [Amycolatopsis pithecellobii]|uniref:Bacterial transcriptional activator domain-containing protein n=1 Tax=Amycolatopsis pithecellobii TaxID=664692 RepID=A0A6N7YLM1_9PSEU|nr:BTAD domain-containing putative transcriptional regulator [Amycolatopsis pithecellobii]MTD53825.1 hypothetical protein [Amycolatopsis pithecellobii]